MHAVMSAFLITLGLGQLSSTAWGLRGASLVGFSRLAGYGLGALLLAVGALILPDSWSVLWWTLLTGPLTVVLLLLAGSFIAPPPHPNRLFEPDHPLHGGCRSVQIPDGDGSMPGFLLFPPVLSPEEAPAICIVPGAGDNKTFFKWRLVQTLLAEGLIVLTIDTPGHGDYRYRLLTYPDCLSTVPAAVEFLRAQPRVARVGLIGISLGGALAIRSLVEDSAFASEFHNQVDALVVMETPVSLHYSRGLFYRELWNTLYRSPVLSLLKEVSLKQIWQDWKSGGYYSQHTTGELIDLLNPLENVVQIKDIPILLAYSHRDRIAPPEMARAMRQAVPQAAFIESKKASHVMLTLLREINRQVACWLKEQLA